MADGIVKAEMVEKDCVGEIVESCHSAVLQAMKNPVLVVVVAVGVEYDVVALELVGAAAIAVPLERLVKAVRLLQFEYHCVLLAKM